MAEEAPVHQYMPGRQARHALGPQFESMDGRESSKMAAASQQRDQAAEDPSTATRQVLHPATLSYTPLMPGSAPTATTPSPASTMSLLERSMGPYGLSSLEETPTNTDSIPAQALDVTFNVADLFSKISELLDRGLTQTADRITCELRSDFQNLGTRIERIEHKLDVTISRANQNTDHLHFMQEQLDTAQAWINDLENRSRRDNFRIHQLMMSSRLCRKLLKSLIPSVPVHKLELLLLDDPWTCLFHGTAESNNIKHLSYLILLNAAKSDIKKNGRKGKVLKSGNGFFVSMKFII